MRKAFARVGTMRSRIASPSFQPARTNGRFKRSQPPSRFQLRCGPNSNGRNSPKWVARRRRALILPHDEVLSEAGEPVPQRGAYVLYVLLIAAVIWHQWIKRDSVLARMMPPKRRPLSF